jgi:hypothetical protein
MRSRTTTATTTVVVKPTTNEWQSTASAVPERFTGASEVQEGPIAGAALGSVSQPILEDAEVEIAEG